VVKKGEMGGSDVSVWAVIWRTVVVHTVSYFVVGLLALTFFDYGTVFSEPELAGFMRPTSDRIVMAGPLFQPLRGFLFGAAFYPLREILFGRARGWLVTWVLLMVIGIFCTFGPAPGSIEGFIYTKVSFGRHTWGLVEVLVQSFALSTVLSVWINHPEKHWLTRVLVAAFVITIALPVVGLIAAPRS
jgi:hypothetical protein